MNQLSLKIILFLFCVAKFTHAEVVELDSDYCDWYFSIGKGKKQYMAIVPGSNINDLVCNQLIANPYKEGNIENIKWVEDSIFTYVTTFDINVDATFQYQILCEGLDTYADVYLNNQLVIKGSNMFVSYESDISQLLRNGTNILKIIFRSAVQNGHQKASLNSIKYPADNEEGETKVSPFVRKAAFQFGWDINPRLISCGIWRPIKIISMPKQKDVNVENKLSKIKPQPFYQLKRKKDEEGESFAFYTIEKKPVQTFMYGANYVPYNMYPLPLKNYKRVAHIQKNQGLPNRYEYYHQLFAELKSYGCNMLRIWGGGWYEDDYFYSLADSMNIAIWQDFMFANTMYPGDVDWVNHVKLEVQQQINKLSKHPCIVLWSGNNEIDVAWKNWGWQKKYHYNKYDSIKLINDYHMLFDSIIPNEIKRQNCKVPYIPSSPISNWGKPEDFKTGDNHYWGIWHGEAPLEDFNTHVPRFASEFGMPSLGTRLSVFKYNSSNQFLYKRMKSYKGMKLLNNYISHDLPTPTDESELSYASRYLQYKALKMAYNAHLYNFPYCSGSLFWQFNESWPGITWAVIDFTGARKIPPYQSKFAVIFDENGVIKLRNTAYKTEFNHIELAEFCLKDLSGETIKKYQLKCNKNDLLKGIEINPYLYFDSLSLKNAYVKLSLKAGLDLKELVMWDTIILLKKEKDYWLTKPDIKLTLIDNHHIKIVSNAFVMGLYLECKENSTIKFNQNFFHLEAGEEKVISLNHQENEIDLSNIFYYSVFDLQPKTK
jgi:beta-mannosidase